MALYNQLEVCSFPCTFLSTSLTLLADSSLLLRTETEDIKPDRNLFGLVKEDGIGELEDETNQGGTLSQQGARKRVERVMLTSGLCLPISSHYSFIPPSVCTSHPYFSVCFLCCSTFCQFCSGASQARAEAQNKQNKGKRMVITHNI